jgi:hypothetical protein
MASNQEGTVTETSRKKSSELRPGMIVRDHGMRVQLGPVRKYFSAHNLGETVYASRGTVLNMDEVRAEGFVPMSYLRDEDYDMNAERMITTDGVWTVQANDLATWQVEAPEAEREPEAG